MRILSLVLFYAVLTASPHGFPGISAEKEHPGFEKIGHGRFYFEKERETNFVIARSSCRRKGAQLAEFEDDKEFQAVMAKAASGSSYWIGIAENKNGTFVSQTTGKPARFLNWEKGQPKKLKTGACVYTNSSKGIATNYCREKLNFICKV